MLHTKMRREVKYLHYSWQEAVNEALFWANATHVKHVVRGKVMVAMDGTLLHTWWVLELPAEKKRGS